MDSTISKGNSFTFIYPSNTSIRLKAINILWKKLLTIGQSSPYAHPNHYNSLRISKQVEKKTNWNNYSVHYFFYSFLPSIQNGFVIRTSCQHTSLTIEITKFQMVRMINKDSGYHNSRVQWSELRYRYCKNKIFKVVT